MFNDPLFLILFFGTLVVVATAMYKKLPDHDPAIHRSSLGPRPTCGTPACRTQLAQKPSDLLASARAAGNYLVRSLGQGGRFNYQYDPITDKYSDKYDLLRHAGTIYSLCQLYQVRPEPEFLETALQALGFLEQKTKPWGSSLVVVEKDKIKSGGNALAILAMAEYHSVSGEDRFLPTMKRLAGYLVENQSSAGQFTGIRLYSTGLETGFESLYYPGESVLALVRMYEQDQDQSWLERAELGAQYLIDARKERSFEELIHDHWLMLALERLYRHRPKLEYATETLRLAQAIILRQRNNISRPSEKAEWLGSFYTPPSSPATAVRVEGLGAAYRAAIKVGQYEKAREIFKAMRLAIGFQLRTQFNKYRANSYSKPELVRGGFAASLEDPTIRIDHIQHNLSAILSFYEIVNAKT